MPLLVLLQVGLGPYSDMVFEDFSNVVLMRTQAADPVMVQQQQQQGKGQGQDDETEQSKGEHENKGRRNMLESPPNAKDHRMDGMVTPVRSQGGCGSCW